MLNNSYQKGSLTIIKLLPILLFSIFMTSCISVSGINQSEEIISEITTYQTSLEESDVGKYFCNYLTEYFNSFNYYKISSEIYYDKDKQYYESTVRIIKYGAVYDVVYFGSGGWYSISFSNKEISGSEKISTFRGGTVLGNAIRDKVYDTFSSWLYRVKIALKANNKDLLYMNDLITGVEIEKWRNSFLR